MTPSVSRFFSQEDLDRISKVVQEAESRTSGEIVPFAVDRSDAYEEAEWRCAALLSSLALALFAFVHTRTAVWLPLDFAEMILSALVAGAAGMGIIRASSAARRFFCGSRLLERRVAQRAAEAFISEEVFNTRDRTGILIFLSVLEHRVMVVGDTGINAKVKPEEWQEIVQAVVRGIRAGKPAEGLIEGVRLSGELLAAHGVARRRDDSNELPDSLRMGSR